MHPHIWTVDSEGGTPRQITNDPGDQMDPTWSRDGEWIYFSWSQANDRDIWRTRVSNRVEGAGHARRRVHRARVGGRQDAAVHLQAVDSPLMAQPLAGGAPTQVIACVGGTAFSVNPAGHLLHAVFAQLRNAGP